jgi:hypothetical protein
MNSPARPSISQTKAHIWRPKSLVRSRGIPPSRRFFQSSQMNPIPAERHGSPLCHTNENNLFSQRSLRIGGQQLLSWCSVSLGPVWVGECQRYSPLYAAHAGWPRSDLRTDHECAWETLPLLSSIEAFFQPTAHTFLSCEEPDILLCVDRVRSGQQASHPRRSAPPERGSCFL